MFLKWLSKNKYKLILLYALKIALFFPMSVHASDILIECNSFTGTLCNFSTISATQIDIYENLYNDTSVVLSSTVGAFVVNQFETNVFATGDRWYKFFGAVDNYYYNIPYGFSPTTTEECNSDSTTRIVNFNPENGTTTENPVFFDLSACINHEDVGTLKGINITLHNIDQNVLLLGSLSTSDKVLLAERDIQNTGVFYFSTTSIIAEGNYRIEACIDKAYFFGFVINPFANVSDCQSHQFIVGTSTFIGNISQNLYNDTNDFLNNLTSTSSEALARTCVPLGSFDIIQCLAFLFIPDANSLGVTMNQLREDVLVRAPWGYFTRIVTILNSNATTSLPVWTASIQVGAGEDMTPEITTIMIDPSDMLAGGANLLDSIQDPIHNKTARDIFYPMVQLTIAIGVLFTIYKDIAGSHNHEKEDEKNYS